MAHICASCHYRFDQASQAMLDGCPDCGGNKFQYQPDDDAAIIDADKVETVQTEPDTEETAQKEARSEILEPDDETGYMGSASDLVSGLQGHHSPEPENETGSEEPVTESPSSQDEHMDELRDELNEQFESIRIIEPGTYELNLERLVERDEYIVQIYEDGCYAIQMPERHMGRQND